MPLLFVPRRSGVHRIAAIALFRALLSKCRLQINNSDELQNVVRNRFRENQNVRSPRLLTRAFRAGYEALDVLAQASKGHDASRSKIQHLITQIPQRLKKPPNRVATPVNAATQKTKKILGSQVDLDQPMPEQGRHTTLESQHPILLRPHTEIKGKRGIPVWTRAHGIPFLRIKKPQPPALSAAIRCRIKRRQKWITCRMDMDSKYIPMGEDEDVWDELVADQLYSSDSRIEKDEMVEAETSWAVEPTKARNDVNTKLREEGEANARLSEEMFKVVEREKALARKESRRAKKTRKYARFQEAKLQGTEASSEQVDMVFH